MQSIADVVNYTYKKLSASLLKTGEVFGSIVELFNPVFDGDLTEVTNPKSLRAVLKSQTPSVITLTISDDDSSSSLDCLYFTLEQVGSKENLLLVLPDGAKIIFGYWDPDDVFHHYASRVPPGYHSPLEYVPNIAKATSALSENYQILQFGTTMVGALRYDLNLNSAMVLIEQVKATFSSITGSAYDFFKQSLACLASKNPTALCQMFLDWYSGAGSVREKDGGVIKPTGRFSATSCSGILLGVVSAAANVVTALVSYFSGAIGLIAGGVLSAIGSVASGVNAAFDASTHWRINGQDATGDYCNDLWAINLFVTDTGDELHLYRYEHADSTDFIDDVYNSLQYSDIATLREELQAALHSSSLDDYAPKVFHFDGFKIYAEYHEANPDSGLQWPCFSLRCRLTFASTVSSLYGKTWRRTSEVQGSQSVYHWESGDMPCNTKAQVLLKPSDVADQGVLLSDVVTYASNSSAYVDDVCSSAIITSLCHYMNCVCTTDPSSHPGATVRLSTNVNYGNSLDALVQNVFENQGCSIAQVGYALSSLQGSPTFRTPGISGTHPAYTDIDAGSAAVAWLAGISMFFKDSWNAITFVKLLMLIRFCDRDTEYMPNLGLPFPGQNASISYDMTINPGAAMVPPQTTRSAAVKTVIVSAIITTVAIAAVAATVAIVRTKLVAKQRMATAKAEAAWDKLKQDPSPANAKAYTKAVASNNRLAMLTGQGKISKRSYWAPAGSSAANADNTPESLMGTIDQITDDPDTQLILRTLRGA